MIVCAFTVDPGMRLAETDVAQWADAMEAGEFAVRCRPMGSVAMLAVNFHLMGGMPLHLSRPALDEAPSRPAPEPSAPVAGPALSGGAAETRVSVVRGDAPAEVVMRRPIALQILLTKVRENLL